ncbi:MAG: hypothetical protein V4616_00220 [Bacteroidota bacterium]
MRSFNEYLNSDKSQVHQYHKRRKKLLFLVVNQEPKSKNISDKEISFFRSEIKRQMGKRRRFQGDVILDFTFWVTKRNPPTLHKLVKNYMDLLHKDFPKVDKNRQLLFKDDSQVKFLLARCFFPNEMSNTEEEDAERDWKIVIKAYSLSNFVQDLQLARYHCVTYKYEFEDDGIYQDAYNENGLTV